MNTAALLTVFHLPINISVHYDVNDRHIWWCCVVRWFDHRSSQVKLVEVAVAVSTQRACAEAALRGLRRAWWSGLALETWSGKRTSLPPPFGRFGRVEGSLRLGCRARHLATQAGNGDCRCQAARRLHSSWWIPQVFFPRAVKIVEVGPRDGLQTRKESLIPLSRLNFATNCLGLGYLQLKQLLLCRPSGFHKCLTIRMCYNKLRNFLG